MAKRSKTILITGGAGFIGSWLTKALINKGYRTIIVDNLSTGSKKNIPSKTTFYKIDVRNNKLENIFRKERPSFIIHLAAQTNAGYSVINPILDANINIIGILYLLQLAIKFKIKKFIFVSSAAVYGNNKNLPLRETEIPSPISPYGCSKINAENYIILFNKAYKLPYVILRLSNVYGPRQPETGEGGVINIFCRLMVEGRKPVIYGKGQQTRDFIYISDVVNALIQTLKTDKKNIIFNVSSGRPISVLNIVKIINIINNQLTKNQLTKKLIPQYLPSKVGDVKHSVLDNNKIKKFLGWQPKISIEQGIKKTLNSYTKVDKIKKTPHNKNYGKRTK